MYTSGAYSSFNSSTESWGVPVTSPRRAPSMSRCRLLFLVCTPGALALSPHFIFGFLDFFENSRCCCDPATRRGPAPVRHWKHILVPLWRVDNNDVRRRCRADRYGTGKAVIAPCHHQTPLRWRLQYYYSEFDIRDFKFGACCILYACRVLIQKHRVLAVES